MSAALPGLNEQQIAILQELAELRTFAGPPKEFWPRYLKSLAGLASGSKVVLLVQDPAPPAVWKRVSEWPTDLGPSRALAAFHGQLDALAADCVKHGGGLLTSLEPGPARGSGHFVVSVRLKFHRAPDVAVVTLLLSEVSEATAREALFRVRLAADGPESYQMQQAVRQATADVNKLAVAHDLVVAVNTEKRFLATALAFCNGLATSFRCQRVSLGWLEGGYLRLRAISRTEKFDRKMAAVISLEAAMDEALDQDEEVLWPAPAGATVVTRDHEKFAIKTPRGMSAPSHSDWTGREWLWWPANARKRRSLPPRSSSCASAATRPLAASRICTGRTGGLERGWPRGGRKCSPSPSVQSTPGPRSLLCSRPLLLPRFSLCACPTGSKAISCSEAMTFHTAPRLLTATSTRCSCAPATP